MESTLCNNTVCAPLSTTPSPSFRSCRFFIFNISIFCCCLHSLCLQLSFEMLPFQRNKIDISVSSLLHSFNDDHEYIDTGVFLQKLNPQEQQLFAKYGKLPTHKNVLMKMQKVRRTFQYRRGVHMPDCFWLGSQIFWFGWLRSVQGRSCAPKHCWHSNP